MKFFSKNIKQDREFIELQTRLNFSYWIASDIDHFYESNKKNINNYEFMKLSKQYQQSLDMFNSVDIAASNISIEHKSALYALRAFVKSCIEFCDIKHDRSLLDSETFETNILHTIARVIFTRSVRFRFFGPRNSRKLVPGLAFH